MRRLARGGRKPALLVSYLTSIAACGYSPPAPPADPPTPVIVGVYPSADSLPENLLRWYVEFSQPMFPGRALRFVKLIDEGGQEVRGAFLDLSEELWDPSGKRLTMLFDPGRVKQGIRTNLESGRPLRAGGHYTLRIEPGWPDNRSRPVAAGLEKSFVATTMDQTGPDPEAWSVTPPSSGGRAALEIDFGEPLDHALATRLIAIQDASGNAISGAVTLGRQDRVWRLEPNTPWSAGRYQILVSPELEDVAGNRPGRPFDRDLSAPAAVPPALIRWFEIR